MIEAPFLDERINVEATVPTTPQPMRSELYLHVFLLAVCSAIMILSFVMVSKGENMVFLPGSTLPMPPSCTSRMVFGIECPGCGLTRAFISISSGQWERAWNFNAAGFAVYLFVAAQIPWRIVQLVRIRKRKLPFYSPWLFSFPIVVAICLLIQWIVKLST